MMSRKFIAIFFFFLLSSTVVHAERIVAVEFTGLDAVAESTALAQITSTEGSEYSGHRIQSDIKALYRSGLFGDVKVDKQRMPGGVKLIFRVTEKSVVGKLTITGNKKIKDDDITEALKIHVSDLVDPARIADTQAAIYRLYEEKGFYLTDVSTEIEPFDQENHQVELIITIHEGRSVKIKRIRFIGNQAFSDKKLKGEMRTKEKGMLSFLSGSSKLEDEKLSNDLQLLRYFYQDHGYLKIKVDDPDVTLTRDKRAIYVSIPVVEGDQYSVSSVDVAGDILTTREELISKLSQKSGETYRKSLERKDVEALTRLYGDQAYAFADVVPQITTNDGDRTAQITYFIRKGPKVKIEKIIIQGNTVTRDKVIRREMQILENSYFSQSALELSRVRLMQLGYFEEVNMSTPRGSLDNTVNIVIDVKEKNTGSFNIGGGYSTLEGIIFTGSIQKENFFGMGWSGYLQGQISQLRQDVMFSLSDRYFLDTRWYLGVTFQRYLSQLNTNFDEDRLGGTVMFGRELFDFFHARMGYNIDDLEVTNFSSLVPQYFQDNATGLTSAMVGSLTYDRRDNRISPKKGLYTSVSANWSSDYLGADNNYLKVEGDQRFYIKLPAHFVLKGRGMAGYINSLDNDVIALYDRYFLGGINTLRGYDLSTVGPDITLPATATSGDQRFIYGGDKMVLFNAELEIPIYAPQGIYAVAFFDAGNSFAETQDLDPTDLRMDYGFGLRWQAPIGPLRFEFGFPIDKRSDDSAMVFNFSIGPSF